MRKHIYYLKKKIRIKKKQKKHENLYMEITEYKMDMEMECHSSLCSTPMDLVNGQKVRNSPFYRVAFGLV
jgi:hypothetical protein